MTSCARSVDDVATAWDTAMVARSTEVVDGLNSASVSSRIKSLRQIKNAIIGSKSKKLCFIKAGALPQVLNLLLRDADSEVTIQSATALGSFAYGVPQGLQQLIQHAGIPALVSTLQSPVPRVVEAGIRALKLVYSQTSCHVPHEPVLQPDTLSRVLLLLRDHSRPDIAEAAALVLAQCCSCSDEQRVLTAAGAADACLDMLASECKPLQASSLRILSRLLPDNDTACQLLLSRPALLDNLVQMLRDPLPVTKFHAASCLTYLAAAAAAAVPAAAAAAAGSSVAAAGPSASLQQAPRTQEPGMADAVGPALTLTEVLDRAKHATLPVLLRLLSDESVLEQVPPVLAKLIEGSEELQKAALDADAVKHLASLLAQPQPSAAAAKAAAAAAAAAAGPASAGSAAGGSGSAAPACSPALQEGVLRALGNLCLTRSDGRKQLIEAKVLRHIVQSLEHSSEGVRAAAALCVMALSRSISTLRSCLLEAEVAEVLCRLLGDSCVDVQVNAAATLCNLVLEFSSVKEALLAQGALPAVIQLTESMVPALRLHGCWALRNLAFKSSTNVRKALMQALPWPAMRVMVNDADSEVQEQAVGTLRNLCMDSEHNISAVLDWAGADLLACLEEKLDPSRSVPPAVVQHALFTVVNILSGSEAHKDAVMASNLLALLAHWLRCQASPELRVAALWSFINLTWPEAKPSAAAASRMRKLRELGVEEQLKVLQEDCNMDVRERATTALMQLSAAGGSV